MTQRPLAERARELRRTQTPAERRVWAILRTAPFDVLHFRRQVPFATRYIADFCSHRARMIIEIDGRTHDLDAAGEIARTGWLAGQGYRIIRFTNEQVGEWRTVERTLIRELDIREG